jgi:hypothetical protein
MAGVSWSDLERGLARAVMEGRLDRDALRRCAAEYGTKATQSFVQRATH